MKKFDFLSNLLQWVSAMSGMSGMRAETINYDGQPAVNRRANMTSVLRHCKASDVSVAREWLQKSSARVAQGLRKSVRFAATILVLLWIGVGEVWGAVPSGWTQVTTLGGMAAGDKIIIVTNDGNNYLNGSTSKGHFQVTALSASAPANASAAGVIQLESTGTADTYKLKLVSSSKYVTATKAGSGGGSVTATSDSYGWTFSCSSSKFDAIYQQNFSGSKAHCRSYENGSFRTYANTSGDDFIIYKYSSGPSITTSVSSLSNVGYSTTDFTQQVKSFTVSGSSLTADVTVTAPTGYEVCKTENGTYTSSVTFDKGSGTLSAQTVYVRLASGKAAGSYSGNVACTSTDATTKNVAVSGSVPFTVTWKANGATHATTYVAYAPGAGTAVGTLPTAPDPSDYTCSPKAFYGWYDGASYSNASVAPTIISTSTNITSDKTFNAVFADISGSTTTYDLITTAAGLVAGEQYVIGHKTSGGSYYYMPNAASNSNPTLSTITTVTGTQITSTVTNAMLWTLRTSDVSGYGYKWESVASSSNFLATATSTGNNIRVGTSSSFSMNSWSISVDATYGWILKSNGTYTSSGNTKTGKYAVIYGDSEWRVYSANSTNAQAGAKFVIFKKSAVATYSNYATSCCTQLGSINGSISWTHPNEAVISWDNLANVSSWTVKYKVHGAGAWTTAFTNNTGSDSEITVYSDGGTDNKMKSTIATTCNTAYDFLIIANPESGYCEKEEELNNSGSGYNSGMWSVAYSLSGVTKSSGPATGANVCGDYTAVFAPSSIAYALPSNVTVKIGGVTKTKDTDYTWDSSTGTLSIASTKITGDLSITVTGIEVGCSADPTIGAASLSGAFGLSSVGVTVGTSSTGSAYCAWTDYGFVWGTSANPTVSDNKVQIGNSDAATTWSGNLTGSFSVGTTYYFRAYGTNSKTGAVPVYGTGNSFTPRSVTFDSNGGSAVATAYVNSGSAVSEPSAPTRTGYDFVKWQLNGADYSFSSAVNANITLVAVWSAKSYTVTFDQQSGSGGSENVSATYDAAMPSATMPTRSGYDFGGYYGSEGGAGTQYYAADGSSAHTWDVADAKTLYAQWTAKNYTITLNNEGADSGKEGTESISVTFNANTNLTSAITKPVKDGYKFGGYYTEEDGSGTQIIDENGNVKASVTSYTSATKQWIYANNIELHAYWKPSYTVTWSVNGETTTEQVVSGERVAALPTAPTSSDCDDAKVFVGWRSTAIDGVSAANPGSIFTTQAASPAITGDVTFYAVFADEGKATRTTLYSEPFKGTCGSNTAWASASSYFYNASTASITTTTNWQVSKYTTNPSDNDGASGGSHMLCGSSDKDIVFDFGDKSSYVDLQLSFNFKNEAGKNTNRTIGCYVSGDDGESWTSNLISVSTIQDQDWHACSYNISNGSTGALQVKFSTLAANASRVDDITLTGCAKTYSNYVTSCSSCDADATFTNTTPAVSAIGCDAATLTMEDGLATLGADGCNVSDYGFVIGTADNPAIGGVDVTKLQVGTTNPTIGADFSYDAEGLTKGTHYYICAYATNRHGTAYSGSQNFWTKGVSSIAITTAPTKTKYVEGETFDATGMVVTATMADGSTEDVTSDCTFSPSLSTKLFDQTAVRATYSLCEVDKTADQAINVYTLTVTEGANDSYGTAGKTDNKVTVTGLGDHKTYTVTVTSGNADKIDNGDGTYTITNATGNVTVRVDYADAVQVKVYYKVDGVAVTGLTRDVYQSETTTLPSASDLATAMTAQGMDIPDDSYPNFVGWSETEFGAQTAEPTLVTGTPTINAEKTYYAVYTNLNVIRLDKTSTGVSTSYPSTSSADASITVGGKGFKVNHLIYQNETGGVNPFLQFKKDATYYGRIYNSDALSNILKVVVAYKNSDSNVKVYACSAAGTISGDAITAGTRGATDPYVYTMPANTQYLMVRGDNGTAYKTYYIDIYHASATVEYMTQFCTRYDITGVTKIGTAVTGGTLSSNYNSACEGKSVELEAVISTGYQFNGWTIKKTDDLTQDVTGTLLGANASSLTPPAFSMPAYAITVSASITEKELTGWTWKQALPDDSQIAIPSKVVLYVGQRAEFDLIEYDPSDVLEGKKGYGVTKEDTYLTQNAKAAAYYKADAKAAVESTTLTLTSTSNSSVQEVINIQIKALPSVTFEDHVHSVVFSAVAATIDESDKRVVYLTKTTPTTSDYSGTTYNTCEEQHEHLVGWIESSWADEHPNATHSEIAGAGAGVFYTAGASIDVDAQNGKTFYAVWSKIE